MKVVLLTGATGFIGKALTHYLKSDDSYSLVTVSRSNENIRTPDVKSYIIHDISPETEWSDFLQDVDVIIHTAARAHIIKENSDDPLTEFRKTNCQGTLKLAEKAAQIGIKRFIFISSVGVHGDQSLRPFTEKDPLSPLEPYAISKLEAEKGLFEIADKSEMEVVIIRPPLVYGPNAPGNFRLLVNWVSKNVPLPLGSVHNKRSFIGLDNLTDFIITCIEHPAAANETFLVSDDEDMSTTELLQRMGSALGKSARLIPVPPLLLQTGAGLFGKRKMARRLLGSLQVDISKAKELLGWRPPVSVDEGLRRTAEAFLQSEQ